MKQSRGPYEGIWKWFTSKKNRHVDLNTLILCSPSKLLEKHNDAALNSFPGSLNRLHSWTTLKPHTNTQDCQDIPVRDCVVSEITYKFCPTDIAPHHLKLKKKVLFLVIQIVLHTPLLNSKMFFWRNAQEEWYKAQLWTPMGTKPLRMHCIASSFQCYTVSSKSHTCSFHFFLYLLESAPRQDQQWKKLLGDLLSKVFFLRQLYVTLSRVKKPTNLFLLHKQWDTLHSMVAGHNMQVKVTSPVLRETVRFPTSHLWNCFIELCLIVR